MLDQDHELVPGLVLGERDGGVPDGVVEGILLQSLHAVLLELAPSDTVLWTRNAIEYLSSCLPLFLLQWEGHVGTIIVL